MKNELQVEKKISSFNWNSIDRRIGHTVSSLCSPQPETAKADMTYNSTYDTHIIDAASNWKAGKRQLEEVWNLMIDFKRLGGSQFIVMV